MKFLIDQNISFRVLPIIQKNFPGSEHISNLGLKNSTDINIWNYAKQNGFVILTHDLDFDDILVNQGFPPKIIRLSTGNLSNSATADLINSHKDEIDKFFLNQESGLMILSK